jgi:hypothetical protein
MSSKVKSPEKAGKVKDPVSVTYHSHRKNAFLEKDSIKSMSAKKSIRISKSTNPKK